MKGIASLIGLAAALMVVSNCSSVPYAYNSDDERFRQAVNNSAYSRYECRLQYHDFRYCE